MLSRVWFFATPCPVAHQAPLSMGLPRQEYWSELPFPSLGDLPDPGIRSQSPAVEGGFFITEPPGKLKRKKEIRKHCFLTTVYRKRTKSSLHFRGWLPARFAHLTVFNSQILALLREMGELIHRSLHKRANKRIKLTAPLYPSTDVPFNQKGSAGSLVDTKYRMMPN